MSDTKKKEIIALTNSIEITDIQQFILSNPLQLPSDKLKNVASQWLFHEKLAQKVPTWATSKVVFHPPSVSIEQASSEQTARWKATTFKTHRLLDLTGGMGIDSYFFSKECETVVTLEQNTQLAEITAFNFCALEATNATVLPENAVSFLEKTTERFDLIYLDPARRDVQQKKVFLIEDCEPNVLKIKELAFMKSQKMLIKFSPLLDIKLAIEQLRTVSKVWVIAVKNDVKELLFLVEKEKNDALIEIETINFSTYTTEEFSFTYENEVAEVVDFASPQKFLYEANAAILKAGAFKSIALKFGLKKLAPNSHLYTNEELIADFPGRCFEINAVMKFDKNLILNALTEKKANITCRNFPLKPEEIRKKLGLKDGGNNYLFFTENHKKEKIVVITKKIIRALDTP
jgi:16S rRNA G966 N2-methylase RsmD